MNPQSFRHKLEIAIEQRDQSMLDELERVAVDCPTTSRLWQEHCLLERAIEQWASSPLLSELQAQAANTNSVIAPSPVGSKKVRNSRFSIAALSGIACLLFVGWIVTNTNQLNTSPAPVAVTDSSSTIQVASRKSTSPVISDAYRSPERKRKPFAPVNHSYSLVEQSKAYLPTTVLPPVIPGVTSQITEEVSQTWERISVLPEEMQQVWKNLNLPTEDEQDETSPTKKMPTEPKAPRKFSLFNMLS